MHPAKYTLDFKVFNNANGLVHTDFKPAYTYSLAALEYSRN